MVYICGREQYSKSGDTAKNMWCLSMGENKIHPVMLLMWCLFVGENSLNPVIAYNMWCLFEGENKILNAHTAYNMWCIFVGENNILNLVILLRTCGAYLWERTRF